MTGAVIIAFARVTFVDVLLAGDNAIAIGALAASLPGPQRRRALAIGVVAALILRIAFSLGVSAVLQIPGVMIVGGLLLFWIGVKMVMGSQDEDGSKTAPLTFWRAAAAITAADIALSLDNVLGVAGAAAGNVEALVFGLILSVALMGIAASAIARIIARRPWIIWIGFVFIELVALRMLIVGAAQLKAALAG